MKSQRLTFCLTTTVVALFFVINLGMALSTTQGSLNSTEPEQEHDMDSQQDQEHNADSQHHNISDSDQQANFFSHESHLERYGSPEGCVAQQNYRDICNYYVEISKKPGDSSHLHFELFRQISEPNKGSWVALGLSKDKDMGEDDMVECVKSGNGSNSKTRAYHSWAFAKRPPTRFIDDPDVIFMEDSQYNPNNKSLICKFRRPIKSLVNIPLSPVEINLERGKYYVLLSIGYTRANSSDQLDYHGDNPVEEKNAYVSTNLLGYQNRLNTTLNDTEIKSHSISNVTNKLDAVSNVTDKLNVVSNVTIMSHSVLNLTDAHMMQKSVSNGTDKSNTTSETAGRSDITSHISARPETISNPSQTVSGRSRESNSVHDDTHKSSKPKSGTPPIIRSDAILLVLFSVMQFCVSFN